ncbi:hypothetical protein JL722_14818 [Aureococcus anophagefferens]|nr:hypothetical protein JL722_14818 [Aureococcus anophagefferens]
MELVAEHARNGRAPPNDAAPPRAGNVYVAKARVDAVCYDASDDTLVVASSELDGNYWTGGLEFVARCDLSERASVHLTCGAADCCLVGPGLAARRDDGDVVVYDREGFARETFGEHDRGARCVAVEGECVARRVASGSADATVKLWTADRSASLATFAGHEDAVAGVAWVGHGLVASGSRDGAVKLWDPRLAEPCVATRTFESGVCAVACLGAESGFCVAAGLQDGSVVRLDSRLGGDDKLTAFGDGRGRLRRGAPPLSEARDAVGTTEKALASARQAERHARLAERLRDGKVAVNYETGEVASLHALLSPSELKRLADQIGTTNLSSLEAHLLRRATCPRRVAALA